MRVGTNRRLARGGTNSTGYLRRIVGDVWGAELAVVEREFTLVGVNPRPRRRRRRGHFMHAQALACAREAGKALAVAA